jgi:N-acetylglucosaminyl-diphospho-decaprenol L-rhamnosyltransferase
VVLADNGSTDGAPEAAAAKYDHVTFLPTGANLGYGGGMNRGVATLDPDIEFLIIANPDVEWGPGSIDELLAAAERWPQAGALGPMIFEPDGSVYPSARRVPDLIGGIGHAVAGLVWKSNPWTRPVPAGGRGSHRAIGGLALRIVSAGAAQGVRRHRRVRPAVLHVHGGRRPG